MLADLWELFRVGNSEGVPWGFLANLLGSTHAATFQETDGPSVLSQLAKLRGRPPVDVDEQQLTELLTLAQIRDTVNDETDRRARDNDPATGPTS